MRLRGSSNPYCMLDMDIAKKCVYEIHVRTSDGGEFDENGDDREIRTDEATLIFEVSGSSASQEGTNSQSGTDSHSNRNTASDFGLHSPDGGCDSWLSAAGLMVGLSLLFIRCKH